MKITEAWLTKKGACVEGKQWFVAEGITDLVGGVWNLFTKNRFSWACWLLSRAFTRKQNVLFSVFCTEKVLELFERKYPGDSRPRQAIEAAKKWIKNPTKKNKNAAKAAANAAKAAANAAKAAANAANAANAAYAAYAAIDAAANAAYAAYAAAYAAANTAYAAYAAYATTNAAAYAAYAVIDTDAAYDIKILIIKYGVNIFTKRIGK